jgi:hypothetical protein
MYISNDGAMGDSFGVDYWYMLSPFGEVTTFQIHPFDSEDDEE